MNCPICGANIEVSEFEDGSVLIRQDCLCKITIEETKKRTLNSNQKGITDEKQT